MKIPRTLFRYSFLFLLPLLLIIGVVSIPPSHGVRPRATQKEVVAGHETIEEGKEPARATDSSLATTLTEAVDAEAQLSNALKEIGDLQAKVQAGETQIVQLQNHNEAAGATPSATAAPDSNSIVELENELADIRKQLEGAEEENALLSKRFKALQEKAPTRKAKSLSPARGDPGIHGTVLAVNRAYNFVVLNLGARQGVEPNTEMLVIRGGSLIGRIRVASVEPATTIGDIIAASLARGVQVQKGDAVIYAGTNF